MSFVKVKILSSIKVKSLLPIPVGRLQLFNPRTRILLQAAYPVNRLWSITPFMGVVWAVSYSPTIIDRTDGVPPIWNCSPISVQVPPGQSSATVQEYPLREPPEQYLLRP